LIAHGRVIDKTGYNGGSLFQVVGLQVIVCVHIGVVRAGAVFDRVLNELETRQTNPVEREMVGAACVFRRYRSGPQVVERFEPLGKNRSCFLIALQIHPSNFTGPIIDIEVSRYVVAFFVEFSGARFDQVIGHVIFRAMQTLFLTTPERQPDGTTGFDANRFQNSNGLHHHRTSGSVVGSPRSRMPGVEVGTQYHYILWYRRYKILF